MIFWRLPENLQACSTLHRVLDVVDDSRHRAHWSRYIFAPFLFRPDQDRFHAATLTRVRSKWGRDTKRGFSVLAREAFVFCTSPIHKLLGNFSATLGFLSNFQFAGQLSVHRETFKCLCLESHSHAPATGETIRKCRI